MNLGGRALARNGEVALVARCHYGLDLSMRYWIEKLDRGVLELDTPLGPRFLDPASFLQRAFLIWTFRNFVSLPQVVLLACEQRLIDRLTNENRFVSMSVVRAQGRPVIGRVERRTSAHVDRWASLLLARPHTGWATLRSLLRRGGRLIAPWFLPFTPRGSETKSSPNSSGTGSDSSRR